MEPLSGSCSTSTLDLLFLFVSWIKGLIVGLGPGGLGF